MSRLKEPSSWGGIGLIATGAAQIITCLVAIFKTESVKK